MEIRFGTPLATVDGARLGTIQRIVLDSETQRLRALSIRSGHIVTRERVIGAGYLAADNVDSPVVALLTAEDIARLPYLSEGSAGESLSNHPGFHSYLSWTGGERGIVSYVDDSANARDRFVPPADVAEPDRDVTLLDARTVVHAVDGKKIGTVAAVLCDPDGIAVSMVLKRAGIFHKGDLYVPTDWAAYSASGDDALLLEWDE